MKTEHDLPQNEALNKTDVSKSVLITGKCEEDFVKWYEQKYISVEKFFKDYDPKQLFDSLYHSFKMNLIR